jgi:hypothetical protein
MHLSKLLNDPGHWRRRAEQLRAAAAKVTDAKAKSVMLGSAAGYDKVAQTVASFQPATQVAAASKKVGAP